MKNFKIKPIASFILVVAFIFAIIFLLRFSTRWPDKPTSYNVIPYRGVNMAGAEFAPQKSAQPWLGGIPTIADAKYFVLQGINTIRLPVKWEYLQPDLNRPIQFKTRYAKAIDRFVRKATDKNLYVIIDLHNYMRYKRYQIDGIDYVVGAQGSPVTTQNLAEFWGELAAHFKDNPKVFFGIMNEPHDMPTQLVLNNTNAAIAAIRQKEGNSNHLILVEGNHWTGIYSWVTTDNATLFAPDHIVDPKNHYLIDVHQYFDEDNTGSHPQCISDIMTHANLKNFVNWAEKYHAKVFVSEFGAPNTDICRKEVAVFLNYLASNPHVFMGWTAWAAGHAWNHAPGYIMGLAPGQADHEMMSVLKEFLTPPSNSR